MIEESDWDHKVEGDAVKSPLVCVSREEVVQTLDKMVSGKSPGPSDVSLELTATKGNVALQVMAEICQSRRWIWNAS